MSNIDHKLVIIWIKEYIYVHHQERTFGLTLYLKEECIFVWLIDELFQSEQSVITCPKLCTVTNTDCVWVCGCVCVRACVRVRVCVCVRVHACGVLAGF